tara:strand:+ start:2631 stop:2837 length:207 start_codon:yes stop_codon:yes gene_type:complete
MTDVNDLINALKGDSMNDAKNVFSTVMQDKMSAALDDRKISLAQGMDGTSQQVEELDNDEVSGISHSG